MGASTGMIGTARMQYHLRQSMVFVEALPLARPEVMIPFAAEKFDDERATRRRAHARRDPRVSSKRWSPGRARVAAA